MAVYFGKPDERCIFQEYEAVVDDLNPKHQRLLLKGLKYWECFVCKQGCWSRRNPLKVVDFAIKCPGRLVENFDLERIL